MERYRVILVFDLRKCGWVVINMGCLQALSTTCLPSFFDKSTDIWKFRFSFIYSFLVMGCSTVTYHIKKKINHYWFLLLLIAFIYGH